MVREVNITGDVSEEKFGGPEGMSDSIHPMTRSECPPTSPSALTSIIIVTHNQCSYTQACLESVRLRTDVPYELIVVDNGSTDETVSFLQSSQVEHLILNETNRGFPAAVNQGMAIARGEQVLLLNNDTIVTTGWLSRMLDVLAFDPRIGLVGPVSNCISGPQQIETNDQQLSDLEKFALTWGKEHEKELVATDRLVGFCLLIRRCVIEAIGLFDEQFGIGNFEDDDFCRRAIQAGFQAVIARAAFVYHFGSMTFKASQLDYRQLMDHNRQLYLQKWSSLPSQSNHPPRPMLSACLIVRDNEETIGACLESIRPWVDEIIVVDTGSLDRTPELCCALGAKVYHWPWQDSFSAARNVSFDHAQGHWLFWMDSDDTIPPECGRQLRKLADGVHDEKTLGYVMQVHCPGADPRDVTVVDHIKLIRNRQDLRFEFHIHEQILPSIRRAHGEVEWTDIFVVHSGADRTEEGRTRKLHRDLYLLKLDLKERPEHPFVLFNLGMTYEESGQHELAAEYLRRCIQASFTTESHLRKAYALLVASLMKQQKNKDAWKACEDGLKLFPQDQELLFRKAMLDHYESRLEDAAEGYRSLLSQEEDRYFSSLDAGLKGYKARHNLAIVLEDLGLVEEAVTQWELLLSERANYAPACLALNRLKRMLPASQIA